MEANSTRNPLESATRPAEWDADGWNVRDEVEGDLPAHNDNHHQEHHSSVDLRRRGGVEWLHELHDWDAGYGAPVGEGGEEDEGGVGAAFEVPQQQQPSSLTHTSEKSLVGLVLVAVSTVLNFVVFALFVCAATQPQFSYMGNGTRVHIYLSGETTGETVFDTTPNSECLKEFSGILIVAVCGSVLSFVSLLLFCLSCKCATKPYRFIRPFILLVAAVSGGVGEFRLIVTYRLACGHGLQWYRAGAGSWCLFVGPILCLLLSLMIFAQVSRYPIINIPMLWGDNNEPTEDDEQAPPVAPEAMNGGAPPPPPV